MQSQHIYHFLNLPQRSVVIIYNQATGSILVGQKNNHPNPAG